MSHAIVGGVDQGWAGKQDLPAGFNPASEHTIVATKTGNTFGFRLDGIAQPSRTAAVSGCQVGAVTEDTRANFRNLTIT